MTSFKLKKKKKHSVINHHSNMIPKLQQASFLGKKIQIVSYFSCIEFDSSFWILVREAARGFSGQTSTHFKQSLEVDFSL